MSAPLFVEIEYAQTQKHGEASCGDAFRSQKMAAEHRAIAVLSDGLGSGLKASILANMTATMALKFVASDSDLLHSVEIIMDALPVCKTRKISYATFTIIDSKPESGTHIVEMGNPPVILVRDGQVHELEFRELVSPRWKDRTMRVYDVETLPEDRIIVVSDGITQSGLGSEALKLGWRRKGCADFILDLVRRNPSLSATTLARQVLFQALHKGKDNQPEDDMTCAVF